MVLTQAKADGLIAAPKRLDSRETITVPISDSFMTLEAVSLDGKETFLFDVNRKGKLKLTKYTYQERHAVVEILVRLDVDGPEHTNPDGENIPCPHIHIYKEGYADKWAYPLPSVFSNPSNLPLTLKQFLVYCNVKEIPSITEAVIQ